MQISDFRKGKLIIRDSPATENTVSFESEVLGLIAALGIAKREILIVLVPC